MNKVLYTSSKLNRLSEIRENHKLLKEMILNTDTRFIPVWNSKNLFLKSNETIEPLILRRNDLDEIITGYDVFDMVFIGQAGRIFYFSINLDEFLDEIPLKMNSKEIICDELRVHGINLNDLDSSILALSKAITFWHKNNKFCGVCGSKTHKIDGGFVIKCTNRNCNISIFPRTDPAIITLISYEDEILLARSSRFPEKMYSTLAGFVEPGETLEQTLDREVFEEVGVTVRNIRYFGSQPWPFPASLMLGFFAEAINQNLKIDYNEIEDAQWFKLSHLKNLTHPKIENGFKLPRVDSIARRLVNHWININS